MRPLLEVQQTQKAAAGNNWRDLLKLIEAIPSRVHDEKMPGDVLKVRTRSASNVHPRVRLLSLASEPQAGRLGRKTVSGERDSNSVVALVLSLR